MQKEIESESSAERTWEDDFPPQPEVASPGLLDFVEGVLLRVALIGLVVIVLGQTIMGQDITSVFMSYADRLTAGRLEPQSPVVRDTAAFGTAEKALITFQLINQPTAPGLRVMRNGVSVGNFSDDQLAVTAYQGDLLELDGTDADGQFVVRIILVAGSVSLPAEGTEYVVGQDRVTVANVR